MSWFSQATGIHIHQWRVTTDPGSFGRALSDLGTGLVKVARNPFSSEGYRQMGQGAKPVATAAVVTAAGLYAFQGPGAAASPISQTAAGAKTGLELEAAAGAGQGAWVEPAIELPVIESSAAASAPSGLELEAAAASGQGAWVEPAIAQPWYAPAIPLVEKIALPVALKMLAPANAPAQGAPGYTIYNVGGKESSGGGPSGGGEGGSWSELLSAPSVGGLPTWAAYAGAALILALAIRASGKR